jgi:hypothetical protein
MMPSMMDINPMVTMITEMIGSPISRRKNIRSTLMARKKVITMLSRKEIYDMDAGKIPVRA